MMLQAYVVANKGKENEQREMIYLGESKEFARAKIRDAIASGFEYGYIKEGFHTIASFNETHFLMRA